MRNILGEHPEADQIYLLVAQGGLYERPTLVQTVLGSCVSVVFFSRRHLLGGIFHALLPKAGDYEPLIPPLNPYRYVDAAVDALAARLARHGVSVAELECKCVRRGVGDLPGRGRVWGKKTCWRPSRPCPGTASGSRPATWEGIGAANWCS
jgi:hypothetical protein